MRQRRPNGQGSLAELEPGRWRVRFQDEQGRRRYIRVTGTLQDAEATLTQARATALRGSTPADRRVTLGDRHERWLLTVEPDVRQNTFTWMRGVARHLAEDAIARRPIAEVRTGDVDAFLARLKRGGVTDRVRREVRRQLVRVLESAVSDDLVTKNAARSSKAISAPRPRTQVLRVDQLQAVLAALAGSRHETLVHLLAASGMRISEALGLTWRDLDLEHAEITVSRSLHRARGRWVISPPKTRSGHRVIPVPSSVVSKLRSWKAHQAAERLAAGEWWMDDVPGLVFRDDHGRPVHIRSVADAVNAAFRSVGTAGSGVHLLRHTAASILLADGADLVTVSSTLGHASPSTTLAIYAHVVANPRREIADRMSAVVGGGTNAGTNTP